MLGCAVTSSRARAFRSLVALAAVLLFAAPVQRAAADTPGAEALAKARSLIESSGAVQYVPVPDLEPEPEPPSGGRGLRIFK